MTTTRPPRLTPLAALLATLPFAAAFADTAAPAAGAAPGDSLPTVSITATRLPKDAETVAPNVTLLAPEGTDAGRVRDIQSLFVEEPGVNVNRDPARRGNAAVNIRGIDGNRVLMTIDGVSLPQLYAGGGAAISGRDMVELDTLAAVEVVKGPYSGLYGADAIGGVVAYRTLSVDDLLQPGSQIGGRLRGGWYGADDSTKLGAAVGFRGDQLGGVVSYVKRRGDALENKGENTSAGSARTAPNPLGWDSDAVLLKLDWSIAPGHTVGLTYDGFDRTQDGDILTSRSAAVLGQIAHDTAERSRTSLGYGFKADGAGLIGARVNVYRQDARSHENVREYRSGNVLRTTDSAFEQEAVGADGQLTHRFDLGNMVHTVVWGAEYGKTQTSRPRMRTQVAANGTVTTVVGGERFPQKTFPDNDAERYGAFVQDEIAFASGLTVTPSLRYDRYRLTPKPDALFAAANPNGYTVAEYEDSAVSPRLSLALPLGEHFTLFGQVGTGFRAPNFDDAMLVFSNAAQGYEVLPNPALEAEKSNSVEIGARWRDGGVELSATAFHNRYKDFIEQVMVSPVDTNGNGVNMEFQARNLARVRIQGVELKAAWRFAEDFRLRGALAYARGDDLEDDVALDSVDPLNGFVALDYERTAWGASLTLRGAQKKSRTSADTLFKAPGYGVLDLSGHYALGKSLTLTAGVYNLADRKYWLWADSRGAAANGAVLDRFTQPGRKAAATVDYRF
ncbi:TonB-dependent hemoglobin/transferrin/lactoferrin family receptor [Chitinimonas koreensis]|uniref:TonB-dependent hemoglobin/transferrin/lactoferrin family receptor n=1 Tax=Chitinimonas koreensis TaxID=356302 RepID=UPI0004277E9C|nr:TonB-dependent hemoglobin/transferrin/lactoferrin family receptor [Chitinimonas koreensis]QNM98317.1 TonB-dependent hemoglobin/transferrin/lactoferrin family receptor [Chitinimonas koreensis]